MLVEICSHIVSSTISCPQSAIRSASSAPNAAHLKKRIFISGHLLSRRTTPLTFGKDFVYGLGRTRGWARADNPQHGASRQKWQSTPGFFYAHTTAWDTLRTCPQCRTAWREGSSGYSSSFSRRSRPGPATRPAARRLPSQLPPWLGASPGPQHKRTRMISSVTSVHKSCDRRGIWLRLAVDGGAWTAIERTPNSIRWGDEGSYTLIDCGIGCKKIAAPAEN
jgi:hypothetical protein